MTAHTPTARRGERPPLRRPLLVLLISVSLSGAACLWGVYTAPASYRVPLAWGVGAAATVFCVVATIAAYQRERSRLLRRRLAAHDAAAAALATETVPALVARLREGAAADTALAAVGLPEHPAYRAVVQQLAQEVGRGENSRAAAMAACANAAGRMQALATSMLADLREMEHRHSDEDVLADLLHLDHRTAQAGRIADSIAVLTGSRSGRRWAKPIVMESILRGAMGRISGYQRIRTHSTSTVAVAGHAAEGVMHALAELLDNATSFSPPTAEVHVYVEEVPSGVVITIEDSGLVMSDVALRRAERAVSAEPLDLTTLSGTRLGLAVVGCLARKHGLSVSFRPSARGGTGALMMIPHELITRATSTGPGAAAGGAQPAGGDGADTEATGGLPRRRATAAVPPAAPTDGTAGRTVLPSPTPVHGTPALPAEAARGAAPPAEAAPAAPAPRLAASGGEPVPSPRRGDAAHHEDTAHGGAAPDGGGVPGGGGPAEHEGHATPADAAGTTGGGLPRRRRGATMAAAHAEPAGRPAPERSAPPPAEPAAARRPSPAESAARFGAFRRAVRGSEAPASGAGTPDGAAAGAGADAGAGSAAPPGPDGPPGRAAPDTADAPTAAGGRPAAEDFAPTPVPTASDPEDDAR